MLRNIAFFITFSFFAAAFIVRAGAIENFSDQILKKCEGLSKLSIKKSMIEFHRDSSGACSKTFTSLIIEKCAQIDCPFIVNTYYRAMSHKPGSVIGDSN